MMRIGMPATYATAKTTGSSVTAVPRSGCRAMIEERDGGQRAGDRPGRRA